MKKLLIAHAIACATAMRPLRAGNDDVTLNVNYGSMDEVPENFRVLYKEAEGGGVALANVVGLKTQQDVNNVQEALRKERQDHAAARSVLSKFGDRDVNDILADLDRIPVLEQQAQGGEDVDKLVNGKLEQHTAPLNRTITAQTEELTELREQVQQFQTREVHRDINDMVGKFATKSKVLPEAVEDVQFMARSIFEKNEAGDVVAKTDIPGVTAGITPEVWLTELQRSKPYYWPASNLPSMGKGNGGQGGANPWHKDTWNMTQQGAVLRENPAKAAQLAAQAGTKVGGRKPD